MEKLRTFHRDVDYIKICEAKYSQINFIFFEFFKKYKKAVSLGFDRANCKLEF
jgi:Zn-dependent oligopeptidase